MSDDCDLFRIGSSWTRSMSHMKPMIFDFDNALVKFCDTSPKLGAVSIWMKNFEKDVKYKTKKG